MLPQHRNYKKNVSFVSIDVSFSPSSLVVLQVLVCLTSKTRKKFVKKQHTEGNTLQNPWQLVGLWLYFAMIEAIMRFAD